MKAVAKALGISRSNLAESTNARSTVSDIFSILHNASGNFSWKNIRDNADAHFGNQFDPRAQIFRAQMTANGLDIE